MTLFDLHRIVFRLCYLDSHTGCNLVKTLQFLFNLDIISFFAPLTLLMIRDSSHGGRVVTLSPPTSEAGVRFLVWPQVGKLVVACCWSAVYRTDP